MEDVRCLGGGGRCAAGMRFGWSFVEVVLAMAVFAVAASSLVGMLGLSVAAGRDARERTLHMVIVPSVVGALAASRVYEEEEGAVPSLLRGHLPLAMPGGGMEESLVFVFDARGVALPGDFSGDYESGTAHPLATHFVLVRMRGVERRPNLVELEIRIESPAVVGSGRREAYQYRTFLNTWRNGV